MVSDVFISRDKVIDAIEREFGDEARPECISAKEAVYSVELADVAPVVHGHWIKDNDIDYGCSVCGRRQLWMNATVYEYCPHCGAKMDEEVKE